jgi:hypothetical protein
MGILLISSHIRKGVIMASLVLAGDTSGSITVSAPAVAGSTTQTLVNVTGTLAPLVSGTAVSASGTSVDFTGIPSWVKRITVMLSGVSTNGSSNLQIQLGDSGGFETTGYSAGAGSIGNALASSTTGLILTQANSAAWVHTVVAVITSMNTSNSWVCSGNDVSIGATAFISTGNKALSDTLTQIRITTVNGTDTFDAGTINILYE